MLLYISSYEIVAAGNLAAITIWYFFNGMSCIITALILRLILLRTTALPSLLLTEKPTLSDVDFA